MGMSAVSSSLYHFRPLFKPENQSTNIQNTSSGNDVVGEALNGSSLNSTGSIASALAISFTQLSGDGEGNSSLINSTSLNSSQSFKVFLLTLVQALDPEINRGTSPIVEGSKLFAKSSFYENYHHSNANSRLEDNILDLVDAVSSSKKIANGFNKDDSLSSLQMSASDLFSSFGMSNSNANLGNLLYGVSQALNDNLNQGSIINAIA